ncbi:efflux RND transporter periplasmic adaptor subunit [Polaribacter ponticola]|uniref:HlyD family efflux transporter periplasmic adaptor subunit n=1 Tax=Polaribacter ponticola TaxID=2978475 RepID=A0ABT5SCU5_9FLAO|nr:HlyD family efflux transporter periplasmic adaptor subunit [Polaribacter sp. MSW5]MDD7915958.1 HlyD family efflux transporter periplasmic adaptor subunit [Polaribacter sp. MSW5]
MDKQIKPKNRKTKKMLIWVIPSFLLIAVVLMNATRKKQVNLKKDSISIREVIKGDFEDVVLFNSTVEPKTSVLVNVIQGGSVSEIFVESGQIIKKGTPLLKVYNPNAELNYLTQETAMIEQINNLRNLRVSIKNQQLSLDQQLLSIDNDFRNAKRQYLLDSTLYKKEVVARNDYQITAQEYKFQKERSGVIKKSVSEEKKSRDLQLSSIDSSLSNMEKSLQLLRKNKENFTVKAPVSGMLSSFNPILGESYNQGQPIGKMDVLDGYKLVANVDEYYISKLREGISGTVSLNAKNYKIKLSKVFPEIVNGQFKLELIFEQDSLSSAVKRGMSLKTKMFLSGKQKALLLPKGLFYQSTNGKWIFVLNSDNKAVKRNIKIGRENPFYYEVTEGLQEGDKIITSSYDDYKTVEEVNIN